jgi:hypothetical protein
MSLSHHPNIVKNGLIFYSDPANFKSYPAGQDPYVNNVSLMLDGETLTDKSLNNVTLGVSGTVTIDSTVKKVGNSSIKFGGALTDYITVPSSPIFAFPGDFTIEFWTYANQWGQNNGATVYFSNGTLDQFQLGVYPNASQINLNLNGSALIAASLSASIVGRWMHIALVRSGSTVTIYENGTVVGSGTSSYSVPASICYISRQLPRSPTDYGHNLNGYIDDFKITKGAKYTSNFTAPTAPLSLPNTSIDLTKNKNSITYASGITYSSTNSGSVALDGVNGSGVVSNVLNVGPTSTFTVCTWAKWNTTATSGGARRPAVGLSTITNSFEFALGFPYTYSSNKLGLEIGKAGVASQIAYSVNPTTTGVWYHLAGVYMNGSGSFYLNGVFQNSVVYNSTVNSATTASGNWLIGTELYNGNTGSNTIGPMNGNVGPTCAYSRILTDNEILQNFNATKARFGY